MNKDIKHLSDGDFEVQNKMVKMTPETTSCPHDPTDTFGPVGMYHCPNCGAMVLAGMCHPSDEDVRFTGIPAYGDEV